MERAVRILRNLILRAQPAVDGGVRAADTYDRVIAAAAHEDVVRAIADKRIVARAADRLLDGAIGRDADIVDQPADRRKIAGTQVNRLIGRITGAIERVDPAAV